MGTVPAHGPEPGGYAGAPHRGIGLGVGDHGLGSRWAFRGWRPRCRPRSLDHLIDGAVALVEVALAEPYRGVADDLRPLIAEELPVAAVRGDEALGHGWGPLGMKGTKATEETEGTKRSRAGNRPCRVRSRLAWRSRLSGDPGGDVGDTILSSPLSKYYFPERLRRTTVAGISRCLLPGGALPPQQGHGHNRCSRA